MNWNVVITVRPGPGRMHQLLGALSRFGRFEHTSFHGVCVGQVDDTDALLENIRRASEAGKHWTDHIARAIPVETVFTFRPEDLVERLREVVTPFIDRLQDGSFCVRLERRGLAGEVPSAMIEREIGEFVHERADAAHKTLRTEFDHPDYIIAAETVGHECGVALLTRAMRERYPWIQTR